MTSAQRRSINKPASKSTTQAPPERKSEKRSEKLSEENAISKTVVRESKMEEQRVGIGISVGEALRAFIVCYVEAPISAGSSTPLIDYSTATQATLPAGALVAITYISARTTVSAAPAATLSVGYVGNTDAFLPASAGCTTDNINTQDYQYVEGGLRPVLTSPTGLVLTNDNAIDSGKIGIIVVYALLSALFP